MASKILEKQVNSDMNVHEGVEDLDSDRKTEKVQDLFYGTNGSNQSPDKQLIQMGSKQVKMSFPPPTKKKIQLTFEDVVIKTIPQQRKCCKKGPVEQSKVILNNVSGTVKPGQFLAIIGASGK
jgi:ABC-type protease/lipase transport system fused ATPase/permease subunit